MEMELFRTWRRMLRIMLCAPRLPEETWIEYVKRTTALAEDKFKELGYENWATASGRKKFRFAGKVAQTDDHRWSKRLLDWKPHFRCLPYRSVGRPVKRWDDLFTNIAGGDWLAAAADAELWKILELSHVQM